ncbi:MAG: cupin [Aestuariivita sp.]|nr:cupin [Aestuariivita sp.]
MSVIKAEIRMSSNDVRDDISFFTDRLGMQMDMIYPADDPQVVVFSGHGVRLRLDREATEIPGTLRILTDAPETFANGDRVLIAPNGLRVEVDVSCPPLEIPDPVHSFVVRRLDDEDPWIIGRAGMHYRDLVPTRLGGALIASHIRIPIGGPVPDMVHFHRVGFQLIFCIHGWVDVLYEDQGGVRRLTSGDCFIQPPEIRHKVMSASDDCQVIEIGVPSDHITEIDHEMTLPTQEFKPDREWFGQRFVHNKASDSVWDIDYLPGFVGRDTTISANTGGKAGVHVFRACKGVPKWTTQDAEIFFCYILNGYLSLETEKQTHNIAKGDAFVVPPKMRTRLNRLSEDIEILVVTLPGTYTPWVEE